MYTIRNCNKSTYIETTLETKKLFNFLYANMIYSMKNKDELKDLEQKDDRQSKVKRVVLVEKLGEQGFHHDVKVLFVPIKKT